jgi:hypothetical protein
VSLSLVCQKLGRKPKGRTYLALPSLWPRVSAQVALQRCPILRTSALSVPYYPSTPSCKRGHLYFAKKGTLLLCTDSRKLRITSPRSISRVGWCTMRWKTPVLVPTCNQTQPLERLVCKVGMYWNYILNQSQCK